MALLLFIVVILQQNGANENVKICQLNYFRVV